MNRKLILLIALVTLISGGLALAEQTWPKVPPPPAGSADEPFTFAVLGDNRPGGADAPQPPVYAAILDAINATEARFVINTGDIISGSTDLAVMNRQLDDFVAVTERLEVPMYVAYGNHELRSAECLQVLEQRIGPKWFAFTYGNSRFYLLNTYVPGEGGRITGEQLAWLREDLATNGAAAAHRFVFFHAPIYSPMNDIGRRRWGDPANAQELQELFADNGVEVVFNGHDHYFAWRMVDDVQHIVTGGAGAPPYQAPGGLSIHHYLLVTVNGDRLSIRLVPVEPPAVEAMTAPAAEGRVILARGSGGWRVTDQFPNEAPPDVDGKHWYEPGYDVSGWREATLPAGYKRGAQMQFATELAETGGDYYFVGSFTAPEDLGNRPLALHVNSDNGAVVYINGRLVDEDPAALSGSGHNPRYWNRTATIAAGIVRPGRNHIAVRLANNQGSSDAYLDLEIVAPE